jgi:hypothetical protein
VRDRTQTGRYVPVPEGILRIGKGLGVVERLVYEQVKCGYFAYTGWGG